MVRVTLIIGLPGSGKTYLANQLSKETGDRIIDDPMTTEAMDLMQDCVAKGENIIVCDPYLCDDTNVSYAYDAFKGHIIIPIYFENDKEKCINNVNYRNDGRAGVIELINLLSEKYNPPPDELSIWQP